MGNWEEFEPIIVTKINEIFKDQDYPNISSYERRKRIFDYLYNLLEFDLEELHNNSKNIDKQIKDVLFQDKNKGICNSIVYVYKIMLEKVNIYSMALFCKDEEDNHTILLVDNEDNTFSFDDLSIAILSKKRKGLKMSKEERFDYDSKDAKDMKQGVNNVFENFKYLLIPSEDINFFFGKNDEYFSYIKPFYMDEKDFFANMLYYIKSFKKQNIDVNKKV